MKARNCSFLLSVEGNDKSPARIHHLSHVSNPFSRRFFPAGPCVPAYIEEAAGIQRRQFTTVAVRAANWFHRISSAPNNPTAPFVPFAFFLCLLLHFLLLFLLSYSHQDETERNPANVPRCPSRVSQKRAVRSSITTVRTVVASSAKEEDDRRRGRWKERKRERKGQEEIDGGEKEKENGTGESGRKRRGAVEEPSS